MLTQEKIKQIIEFVTSGGVWTYAVDKLPAKDWKGKMRNKTLSGEWHEENNVPFVMIDGLLHHTPDLIVQWLDDSESTKEKILSILSCLVISESDEEAAERFIYERFGPAHGRMVDKLKEAYTTGLTHARLQMQAERPDVTGITVGNIKEQSAEIKALEEKVKALQLELNKSKGGKERKCPYCGSTDVIVFTADDDMCNKCGKYFPGS